MIETPDEAFCDVCREPATVHLTDTHTRTEHLYCRDHRPSQPVGESCPRFVIKRWRISPRKNSCPERLAAPKDSQEHQDLYWEMCEVQLLGGEGACRYYLSMLTGIDHFALWSDEYVANLREFVIAESAGAAARFAIDFASDRDFWPYLKLAYERQEGNLRRTRKKERAIELLVNHPDWTDQDTAAKVPTTLKQLERNTYYSALRRNLNRQAREQGD